MTNQQPTHLLTNLGFRLFTPADLVAHPARGNATPEAFGTLVNGALHEAEHQLGRFGPAHAARELRKQPALAGLPLTVPQDVADALQAFDAPRPPVEAQRAVQAALSQGELDSAQRLMEGYPGFNWLDERIALEGASFLARQRSRIQRASPRDAMAALHTARSHVRLDTRTGHVTYGTRDNPLASDTVRNRLDPARRDPNTEQ